VEKIKAVKREYFDNVGIIIYNQFHIIYHIHKEGDEDKEVCTNRNIINHDRIDYLV